MAISVIRLRISALASAAFWANGMDSSICGTQSGTKCPARRNLKNYVYFVARNTSPKAESALPRLNQWLNRTLRSIVPKTPKWRSFFFGRRITRKWELDTHRALGGIIRRAATAWNAHGLRGWAAENAGIVLLL